jgi:hypothetical protein
MVAPFRAVRHVIQAANPDDDSLLKDVKFQAAPGPNSTNRRATPFIGFIQGRLTAECAGMQRVVAEAEAGRSINLFFIFSGHTGAVCARS